LRITHLNKRYWPHIGGVERSLHMMARACVRRGDHVSALVCGDGLHVSRFQVDGVNVIQSPSFGVFQSQPISPSYLRLPPIRNGIWHLHEPFPLGTLAVLLNSRGRARLPLIVTWHSDVIRQRALKPLHAALARRMLQHARFIHVPTDAHVANSAILADFQEKVRAIPFIVDVDAMRRRPDHQLAVALREWAAGAFVVLAVGRLVYYKGIDVLLDALSTTRHIRLVVAGDGPLRGRLERHSAALGIADRVRWLGEVTDDELVGTLSAADLFVLPSVARSEAFGLVQVEAMAAGLPVVSTRLGTSVEIVNVDGSTGIVIEPNSPAVLADAIQTIADDAALRARLATGALRRAEDFDESRLVERYRTLYAEAIQ
jgi:glycosyltransferase involved in cell wall biosynthesis